MAEAGAVVARTLELIGELIRPGVTTAELDALAEEFIRSRGGVPDVPRLPRRTRAVPGLDLHLAERDGRPRDPGPATGSTRATSCPCDVGVTLGRLRRRLRVHVPGRRDLGRGAAAARRLPGRARAPGSSRPAPATTSATSRPRSRTSTEEAGFSVVRSARRPRRRALDARGAADPELRRARARPAARDGHDARDRADDHRRRPGGRDGATTAGRSRPPTARSPRTSSTRSRSPTEGPRILTMVGAAFATVTAARGFAVRVSCPEAALAAAVSVRRSMPVKEEKIEVEGEVVEALPSTMFRVQIDGGHDGAREDLREDAQALHPHPPGRQGQGGALALRPDSRPNHVPTPLMKVTPVRQAHVRALPRDQAARHDHGDLHEPPAQAEAGVAAAWHASPASTSPTRSGSRSG